MKIEGLALLSLIIILPMAILLNNYSKSQIKTLELQMSYDSKLQEATHDAIQAFQLNMSNSSTSDIANSKIRDIEASINLFYTRLASSLGMTGYEEDVIKNYIPAIVYTLYDGYYIYSAYENTLDDYTNSNLDNPTYKDEQTLNGLKPYIYYSCRYVGNNYDIVITYSLDSYITIQGVVGNQPINDSGYLLTGVGYDSVNDRYTYRGIAIEVEDGTQEGFKQNMYLPNEGQVEPEDDTNKINIQTGESQEQLAGWIVKSPYRKINGSKYYLNKDKEGNETVITLLNDNILPLQDVTQDEIKNNDSAIQYYKEAYEFKERIKEYGLEHLSTNDAVDTQGNKINQGSESFEIFSELYDTTSTFIEDENSKYNSYKIEVIKNSIETNLITAISNYNKVSTSDVNFQMPKLEDYEWEQVTNNISVIAFMQGQNIGTKIYNGHAIVQNDISEDFVSEDSIYLLDVTNNEYHKFSENELIDNINLDNAIGIFNVDFERRTSLATWRNTAGINESYEEDVYFFPREDKASYKSIINPNSVSSKTVSELMSEYATGTENQKKLAKLYYTALARERYGQYRVARDINDTTE